MAGPTYELMYSGQRGGIRPGCGLIQATDGNFYGTSDEGGASIFKMTPAGVLTPLVLLTSNGATNKGNFITALMQGSDGNFYGTTSGGGAGDFGTVFKMTPAGVLTTLVEFTGNGATNKGMFPQDGLMQGSDGNFYGTTFRGGASNEGTVFKMTPAGALTTLVEFTGNGGTKIGSLPSGCLMQGSDGNIYGTTCGAHYVGTVFRLRFGPTPRTLPSVVAATATPHGGNSPK